MKLLALDPSFTATGWCVIDLATERVLALGVIRNPVLKDDRAKRATEAENDARRGLVVHRAVRAIHATHKPEVTAIEGDAGSQAAKAAKGLARAQQSCVDAIDVVSGTLPVFVTPQATKKCAVGKLSATDAEMRAAMEARWLGLGAEIGALMRATAPYPQPPPPPGEWHNAIDALGVANAAWDDPAVASLRSLARSQAAGAQHRARRRDADLAKLLTGAPMEDPTYHRADGSDGTDGVCVVVNHGRQERIG